MILADFLLTATGIVFAVQHRHREAINLNAAVSRRKFAKRKAKKIFSRLTQLQKKSGAKNHAFFFEEAEKLINQYLADKLNVSPHNLTVGMISAELLKRNVSGELIKRIQNFYDSCGYIRYGGVEEFETRAPELLEPWESPLVHDS